MMWAAGPRARANNNWDLGATATVGLLLLLCLRAGGMGESVGVATQLEGDWRWECRDGAHDGKPGEVACRCYGPGLKAVPDTLHRSLHSLTIEYAGIETLEGHAFKSYKHTLSDLVLRELRHLQTIEPGVFAPLSKLRSVYIYRAPRLLSVPSGVFQHLPRTFRVLRIVQTGLQEVPDMSGLGEHDIMDMIDLESNRINQMNTNSVRVRVARLILDYNAISSVSSAAFNGSQIAKLSLRGNRVLEHLSPGAFHGLSSLRELDLSETAIKSLPTDGLEELDVLRIEDTRTLTTIPSVYSFKHLQEAWLTYSFHCCAFAFPATHDPERHHRHQQYLARIAQLCRETEADAVSPEVVAELAESEMWDPGDAAKLRKTRRVWKDPGQEADYPPEDESGFWANVFGETSPPEATPPVPQYFDPVWLAADDAGAFASELADDGFQSEQPGDLLEDLLPHDRDSFKGFPSTDRPISVLHGGLLHHGAGVFHEVATLPPGKLHAICGNLSLQRPTVRCQPAPNALNPCEDIMGYSWLRGLVWLVVAATVAGNLAVLAVLLANVPSLTVPRFLMCHLALADLCMGLYLLLLAAMDLQSRGQYFNYACAWQVEQGCAVAGFLTIFSSQLSIYTLCVITLERWFAITYAIDLNKRLRIGAAANVMAAGWVYAITMAALPLFGVSSYASTSICLPMEYRDAAGLAYLIVLLLVAALAFVIVLVCYLQIYLSLGPDTRRRRRPATTLRHSSRTRTAIRHSGPTARAELSVANKMALLVLTDFTCWAPIAFFSLTALAGHPLISVTNSKILLVFFYPLNACANPFLYAILTAQYRRDLCLMLSRCGLCTRIAQRYKMAAYSSPTTNNSNQPVPLTMRDRDAACYDGPETMSSLIATPPASRTSRLLSVDPSRDEAFV